MVNLKKITLWISLVLTLISCIQENKNSDEMNQNEIINENHIDTLSLPEKIDSSLVSIDNKTVSNHEQIPLINEDSCWREAKKENTIDSYENYLINFPKGKYKKKAKNALKKLTPKANSNYDSTFVYKTDFPIKKPTEGYKGSYLKFTDDRDGNTYNVVKIGELHWFAENLRYQPKEGKFWSYGNNPHAVDIYGYLYDWETALEACPKTWRLPEDKDWLDLERANDNKKNSARSLKSVNNWKNGGSITNSTGFSAIPAGIRTESGNFVSQNAVSFWWTATELNRNQAFYRNITASNDELYRYYNSKNAGYSVRCVK